MRDELKEKIDVNKITKNGNIDSRDVNDINVPHTELCGLDEILANFFNDSWIELEDEDSPQDIKKLNASKVAKQQIIDLIKQAKPERENENLVDSMTGKPVETYGYEETHNRAIDQYETNLLKALG